MEPTINGNDFDKLTAKIKTVKLTELPDDFEPSKDKSSKIANLIPWVGSPYIPSIIYENWWIENC